jgi:hypothetical protein
MPTAKSQKTKKKGRRSNATKLAHKKFRWFEQLSDDPDLPLLALRACLKLASKCSLDNGGVAIIGQDTLAKKLGVWRQQVNRALRQAIARGHLESIRRGRDHANAYRLVLKDEMPKTAADDVCKSQTSDPNMMSGFSTFDVCDPQTDSPFFSPGALTEPPGEGERTRSYERDSSPGGAPPLTRDPAEEEASSPSGVVPLGPESPIERSRSVERAAREERFADLREIWRRPWADDVEADRRAFEVVCREVAPEDIIEAATAWVAAADAPRFLPPLSRWLAARVWEKPPPMKARRSHGNGRHNSNARGPVANVFFEIAGYEQDADGNWMGGGQ